MSRLPRITYVTSSNHKRREFEVLRSLQLLDGEATISASFDVTIADVAVAERLEINIEDLVRHEVVQAYREVRVPCFVEHAGLVFDGYPSYPGGLTKPMWNALGGKFVHETSSEGRAVVARACVAYCDGRIVQTFSGERPGTLHAPGSELVGQEFYWDAVFRPEGSDETYSEMTARGEDGQRDKLLKYSQSREALVKMFKWLHRNGVDALWR